MAELIALTDTSRLKVIQDTDAECPRGDWGMVTGFVNIPDRGDSRRSDVPAVHADPIGIYSAHDRFAWQFGDPEDALERWAKIFHDMYVEYDHEHGGYWFVDPKAFEAAFPASPTGRVQDWVRNPYAYATKGSPFYYLTWGDSLAKQAEVIKQEQETYQKWADGEVYGVVLERRKTWAEVTPGGVVVGGSTIETWEQPDTDSSIWGCYLDETYTAEAVALESFDLTDEETEALRAA